MSAVLSDSEADTHLVVLRLWPCFARRFPFAQIEHLEFLGRDEERTLTAVRSVVARTIWKERSRLAASRRKREAAKIAAIRSQSARRLGGSESTIRQGPRTKFAQPVDRRDQLFRLMAELNWGSGSGLGSELAIVSPPICVASVRGRDLAANLAAHLDQTQSAVLIRQLPSNLREFLSEFRRSPKDFFVPRFTIAAQSSLPVAERTKLQISLSTLRSNSVDTIWVAFARSYVSMADEFADAWLAASAGDALQISIGPSSATVIFKGNTYHVDPMAAEALQACWRAGGAPVGLESIVGSKPKRVVDKLPDPLRSLLASSTKGHVYLPAF